MPKGAFLFTRDIFIKCDRFHDITLLLFSPNEHNSLVLFNVRDFEPITNYSKLQLEKSKPST